MKVLVGTLNSAKSDKINVLSLTEYACELRNIA